MGAKPARIYITIVFRSHSRHQYITILVTIYNLGISSHILMANLLLTMVSIYQNKHYLSSNFFFYLKLCCFLFVIFINLSLNCHGLLMKNILARARGII